ncbi:hypothetical protein E4U55_006626 [Claviceps digitariae]|nr:hypothetical protein E4U55_006626 [Claviceps digitariae]
MAYGRSADDISKAEFDALVAEYPAVVEAISRGKAVKPGQKSLRELDAYRYGEALGTFGAEDAPEMTLAEVQDLVEWKLRHGTFRPTLMKLVSSNDPQATKRTISSAVEAYRARSKSRPAQQDIKAAAAVREAVEALTALRGIGPATASLLLSVHDPRGVIFFSDEAYWWVCCGGRRDVVMRYSGKEYGVLCERAGGLVRRLGGGTGMVDVEKAAYVAMRRGGEAARMGRKADEKGVDVKTEEEEEEEEEKAKVGEAPNMNKEMTGMNTPEDGHAQSRKRNASRVRHTDSPKGKVTKREQVEQAEPLRRSKRLNR